MKKFIVLLLASCLLLLVACGGGADSEPSTNGRPRNVAGNHSFIYNGTAITMGADPTPVRAALGEPRNEMREPNCAIEGEDVLYTYPGIILTFTYPADGGAPFITGLRLLDDSVATPEGLTIGSYTADITQIYGVASREDNNFFYFDKGQSSLEISVNSDGEVNQVIYQYLFLG